MPSLEQIRELSTSCTWQWTQRNGVNGQLVMGPNGNTMFLPATGFRWGESLNDVGSYGYCWSRTLNSSHLGDAYDLDFSGVWFNWGSYYRDCGFSVRAVRVAQN